MEIELCIIPSAYVSACIADCGWEGGLSLLKEYPRIPDLSRAWHESLAKLAWSTVRCDVCLYLKNHVHLRLMLYKT